jgi:hypothetical protein
MNSSSVPQTVATAVYGMKLLRLGCKFKPPSIWVEYTQGTSKKEYHEFPIAFGKFSDPRALYLTLTTDNPTFFNEKAISPNKLKHFIHQIIEKAPDVDLRDLNKADLVKYKEQMNREFELNAIKPGDPNFQYDLRCDVVADEPCDWDD